MKIIDRHIGWTVLVSMGFGVAVLSVFLMVGNLFRELLDLLINENLPLGELLSFLALVMPFSLSFTIPWGFLTAVMLLFGRMSGDHELVALQASGVSLLRVCAPVFLIAAVLSSVCLWINIDVAPRAKQKMLTALNELVLRDPMALFAPDRVIDQLPDRRIFIGSREGNTLANILIFELAPDKTPLRMISAREGTISMGSPASGVRLQMRNVRMEERSRRDPQDTERIREGLVVREFSYQLPMDQLMEPLRRRKSLSAYTLAELRRHIAEGANGELLRAEVEFHKRFSISLACLAFAAVAIPLAVTAHRKETSAGFGIALVVAFAYYLFITVAKEFESGPAFFPILLIWLPNGIFLAAGAALFRRLIHP